MKTIRERDLAVLVLHLLTTIADPLYRFGQWQRNLRILDVQEIKTVPYVPLSHPFVERLIGTIRRECLDCTLF
jgi:putative transposase